LSTTASTPSSSSSTGGLWNADAVHAHPLVNTATLVVAHEALERFLAATGHTPRIAEIAGR
jgi:hypothetical protein